MKCLAGTQGSKARVNAVLPGLLLTEWVRTKTRGNPCIIANHHGNYRANDSLPRKSKLIRMRLFFKKR